MEVPEPRTDMKDKSIKGTPAKLEFQHLMGELEERLIDTVNVDTCLDWIVQYLRQGKHSECLCQGLEDEVTGLKNCRQIFQQEVLLLKDEIDLFHRRCEDQMALDKQEVRRHKKKCSRSIEKTRNKTNEKKKSIVDNKMVELNADRCYLERKQSVLAGEEDLLNREEALTASRRQLEDMERELDQAEVLLTKRQMMCERKQEDLINLNQELKELRLGLEVQHTESSERAQRNWEILRRDLQDRHKLLESNVQKYRTELASASATITGKDIHINKLQKQIYDLNGVIEEKDVRIRSLESRLSLALAETMKIDHRHFPEWREHRGSINRANYPLDRTTAVSSAEDGLPTSPVQTDTQQRQFQRNSVKRHNLHFTRESPDQHHCSTEDTKENARITIPSIYRNHKVNGEGEITSLYKKNSSGACVLM